MKQELKEYSDAFEAHVGAVKSETAAKILVTKTRYALMKAREALKDREHELLSL